MSEPREMTVEECRKAVLEYVAAMVDYWLNESRTPDVRHKLEGLAFSILVMIDGESALPAFGLYPEPHESDKEYRRAGGENWWPEGDVDLGGPLHEQFHKFTPPRT